MQETALLVGGAVLVALSVTGALVAWIVSLRSMREHRAAMEQAVRAKEDAAEVLSQEVARLDDHLVALRELDSIRFAQRYIDAKSGLESRVNELRQKLAGTRARRETLQRELDQMLADDGSRTTEMTRVRADLIRAQQEAHRLEQILESLSEVGPIPAHHVRAELAKRREKQVELRGRLDRLSLGGAARDAAVDMLRVELDKARGEERELERDLEIAHSAAPILDGLLGISADVTDRLRSLQLQLGGPVAMLAEPRQTERFLRVIAAPQQNPNGRLLESTADATAGNGADAAAAGEAAPVEPVGATGHGAGV